jgi:hypothetical protein
MWIRFVFYEYHDYGRTCDFSDSRRGTLGSNLLTCIKLIVPAPYTIL